MRVERVIERRLTVRGCVCVIKREERRERERVRGKSGKREERQKKRGQRRERCRERSKGGEGRKGERERGARFVKRLVEQENLD
jgi:hypothetical protein